VPSSVHGDGLGARTQCARCRHRARPPWARGRRRRAEWSSPAAGSLRAGEVDAQDRVDPRFIDDEHRRHAGGSPGSCSKKSAGDSRPVRCSRQTCVGGRTMASPRGVVRRAPPAGSNHPAWSASLVAPSMARPFRHERDEEAGVEAARLEDRGHPVRVRPQRSVRRHSPWAAARRSATTRGPPVPARTCCHSGLPTSTSGPSSVAGEQHPALLEDFAHRRDHEHPGGVLVGAEPDRPFEDAGSGPGQRPPRPGSPRRRRGRRSCSERRPSTATRRSRNTSTGLAPTASCPVGVADDHHRRCRAHRRRRVAGSPCSPPDSQAKSAQRHTKAGVCGRGEVADHDGPSVGSVADGDDELDLDGGVERQRGDADGRPGVLAGVAERAPSSSLAPLTTAGPVNDGSRRRSRRP
jgi:hypothetical protein